MEELDSIFNLEERKLKPRKSILKSGKTEKSDSITSDTTRCDDTHHYRVTFRNPICTVKRYTKIKPDFGCGGCQCIII